jgi:LPS export ABC transporter permease LptG
VFFDQFPNRVLYVRDRGSDGGWRDVFLVDSTRHDQTTVYFAKNGGLLVDREKRTVQLLLNEVTRHTTFATRPDEYEGSTVERVVLDVDPETVFPRVQLAKGEPEMTIAELRQRMVENAKHGDPGTDQLLMIHQKFSLPVACLVLALVGIGLGVSNRKDGKLASFVLGFGVIFTYYIIMWTARSLAKGGRLPAEWAPWVPNIVIGIAGLLLFAWRLRSSDQPVQLSIPTFWKAKAATSPPAVRAPAQAPAPRRGRVLLVLRIPHLNLPRPSLLDSYVARQYLGVFVTAIVSLLGIFYISTFVDLADELFRGDATTGMLFRFFYFQTPQYLYYVIPMAALVSALVTIGVMTKNSELVIMKACGISLYRAAVPLIVFALIASGVLFGLQEKVLAYSNREAGQLNRLIRGYPPLSYGPLNRRWMIAGSGDVYHFEFFDAATNRFTRMSTYHLADDEWGLDRLTFARQVDLVSVRGESARWVARDGWTRELSKAASKDGGQDVTVQYEPFVERELTLEPPDYFKTEELDAERMTYGQLKGHVAQLHTSGFNAVPYMVQLQRKIAFPFVTLVITMLAIPFAVTTGRRGTLYGIGAGIVVAIMYWTATSIFAAIGAGGWIAPTLAAWAPNILFGAVAAYLILTVRT